MTPAEEKAMLEGLLGKKAPQSPPVAPPPRPRSSSGQFVSPNSAPTAPAEEKRNPSQELAYQKKELSQEFDDNAAKCLQIIKPGKSEGLSQRVDDYKWKEARKRDPIGWTTTTGKLMVIGFVFVGGLLFLLAWGVDTQFDTKIRTGIGNTISPDY